MQLKKKAQAGEPRPRRRPQKNPMEAHSDSRKKPSRKISNKTIIRANKNIKEQGVEMSLIKTNSKIHKPKLYNKAIDDPIYSRC